MTRPIDPFIATPETIREDARLREAEEAEMRYARTGLTIDAEKAVKARAAVQLYCANCHCPYSFSEPPEGPQGTCLEETCPCHTAYWQTVPENVKRRLWGDR